MTRLRDLKGIKFGKLTVLHRADNRNNVVMWRCDCECGESKDVSSTHLVSGHTKSCGCILPIVIKDRFKNCLKSKHPRMYRIWQGMKTRCYNRKSVNYNNYGGRGIFICNEWINDFEKFVLDMGLCQVSESIERKDNNKGYSVENCKWASIKEQSMNKRNTARLEYNNEIKTIKEWSDVTGIRYETLIQRRHRGYSNNEIIEGRNGKN